MDYVLGWAPFVVNVLLIPKIGPEAILFIPVSLFIGLIIIAVHNGSKMSSLKKKGLENTPEYKECKKERDIALLGMIAGLYSGYKNGKETIEDIMDVDHWDKV